MNEDLLAALREGVRAGVVPVPVSGGESLDDFRLRVAHAGAMIGIRWATDAAIAAAEAEARYQAAQDEIITPDATSQGWRPSGVTVTSLPFGPPEQNEAAGV